MKEVKALYLANAREFMRDRMTVFLVLLLPVALAVFFGLIFGGGGDGVALQLGVVNEDVGSAGEEFLSGLEMPEVQEALDLRTGTRPEMLEALNKGQMIDFYLPNMLGIALLWLGLFGTAMPLVQQRESQVLRRLSVTPLTPSALLAAQVAWRVTVGLLQAALFLAVGYLGFGVGIAGNKLLFVGAVTVGTLVFVSMGCFLAGLASSSEGVSAVVQIVNFPMMMLSGSLVAVEMLPAFFKPVVSVMPLTYLGDALRQIMVGAAPLYSLGLDFAVLGGWLVVLLALAARFWRWE